MRDAEAAQRLDRLRAHRPTYQPGTPVGGGGGVLESVVATLKREDSDLARVERALRQALPPELAAPCNVYALAGKRLTLAVPNQAVRYRLDRWVRAGGETSLSEASSGRVARVRIIVGSRTTASDGTP